MSGTNEKKQDGIHGLVPREKMSAGARKVRDTYNMVPGAPFYQREFGFYAMERWKTEGMPEDVSHAELFGFDPPGGIGLSGLGWCEAAFEPGFEVKVLEDRGEYELVQDSAGRGVLYFKGRRNGFMPTYESEPVEDWKTWEEKVKWRLNPESPERWEGLEDTKARVQKMAGQGGMVTQRLIGGYMYLRSLMGPEGVMIQLCEAPDLVHDCMETWFKLSDAVIANHQEFCTIDEIFFAEDICYNHGLLISPDMMREFLLPYYQQLITNLKGRQLDPDRHVFVQVDTDGDCRPSIPLYQEIGLDVMSPFEVAAGCDVVELGKQYPDLVMTGGFDKRILADGPEAIDREVDRIFPAMRERGGYIPTCDHGVPEEVSYENYLHYRKRCLEFAE